MAITANVTNGKLDKTNTTPTQNRKTSSAKASGSNLGYDDFLKLLSAEMQYQDPLEPTSNTDYVAQMATFSQLEATLSMKESMSSSYDQTTKSAALSLVGKEVIVTDKDSASGYYSGKVDYVTYKDGKIQLSINEKMYDYSSLYSVSTDEYYDAIVNSSTFSGLIAKLPKIEDLTIDSKGSIEGADEAIKSLELGAFDFVTKPNNIIEAKGNQFKETLLRVVYAAVRITPAHSASRNLTVVEKKAGAIVNKHKAAGSNKIVAIASSTGGPKALQSVIPFLPAELLAPVVLVQHMPAGFTKSMAERLNELSQVQVKEASNGEVLKNGVVYIAPGGTHIAIKKSGASHVISFNDMPPISGLKPCANIMFDSLTSSNYDEVVCVVLTGMGADGTNGILSLGKSKPIYVIAQDEKSSVVYGMPRAIYEAGVVDEVVTLSDVAKAITKNVGVK